MPFSSASPSLGPSCSGSRPASARARAAGTLRPADHDLARPDHRRGHVRQRGQVARGTHRALGRHDRDQVALQHRFEHGNSFRPNARGALRETRELERHHQSHDRRRRRLAHACRVRQHKVALQGFEVADGDLDARQFAEAGVDAINRLALGHDPSDGQSAPRRIAAAAAGDRASARAPR